MEVDIPADQKVRVRTKLNEEKIRLWLPPYTKPDGRSKGDEPLELANRYAIELTLSADVVWSVFEELRSHACAKLYQRQNDMSVRIKMVGDTHIQNQNGKIMMVLKTDGQRSPGTEESNPHPMLDRTRRAAEFLIRNSKGGLNENYSIALTDQAGKPLKLPQEEEQALTVAMMLCERGRAKLKRKQFCDALPFLLGADAEFKVNMDYCENLVTMGYSKGAAAETLIQANNDLNNAIQILAEHPELLVLLDLDIDLRDVPVTEMIESLIGLGFDRFTVETILRYFHADMEIVVERLMSNGDVLFQQWISAVQALSASNTRSDSSMEDENRSMYRAPAAGAVLRPAVSHWLDKLTEGFFDTSSLETTMGPNVLDIDLTQGAIKVTCPRFWSETIYIPRQLQIGEKFQLGYVQVVHRMDNFCTYRGLQSGNDFILSYEVPELVLGEMKLVSDGAVCNVPYYDALTQMKEHVGPLTILRNNRVNMEDEPYISALRSSTHIGEPNRITALTRVQDFTTMLVLKDVVQNTFVVLEVYKWGVDYRVKVTYDGNGVATARMTSPSAVRNPTRCARSVGTTIMNNPDVMVKMSTNTGQSTFAFNQQAGNRAPAN